MLRLYSDVLFNDQRQGMERRGMYVDDENDYYRQVWYSLETGEVAWQKEETLRPDLRRESVRHRRDAE